MRDNHETRYDFIKSPDCREVVADGFHGGVGPRNRLNLTVFTERNHIPASVTHAAGTDGAPGPETAREARDGVVRVIGTILLLDLATARALHAYLGEKIAEMAHGE